MKQHPKQSRWVLLGHMSQIVTWATVIMMAFFSSAVGMSMLLMLRDESIDGFWNNVWLGIAAVVVTIAPWWTLAAAMVLRDQGRGEEESVSG